MDSLFPAFFSFVSIAVKLQRTLEDLPFWWTWRKQRKEGLVQFVWTIKICKSCEAYGKNTGLVASHLRFWVSFNLLSSQRIILILLLIVHFVGLSKIWEQWGLWKKYKSSVFTFKILIAFWSSVFTKANLNTFQKPSYPVPPIFILHCYRFQPFWYYYSLQSFQSIYNTPWASVWISLN